LSFLINPYSFASGDTWEETFAFGSSFPTAASDGDTGTYTGVGGTIQVSGGQMVYDNVDQPCSSYSSQLFSGGNILSDTMYTMLGYYTQWTFVQSPPAPCFYGASTSNNNLRDANNVTFLGGLMAGCGTTNKGDHGCNKAGTAAVAYSACWTGDGSGTKNWTVMYRTSATGSTFLVYGDNGSGGKGSQTYNDSYTISSSITGLDRLLCCGQNDSPYGRDSDGVIEELIFKNGVNSE
tara:strand:- start:216 stop:923 length:708 start_codon:yes stop_codon:yes gene_type:complete